MREEKRRAAVRTLWGMIAASPVVYREQGNHPCVHRELLREWLSAIVAMPLDITQDKSMLHLLEAELRQRDVQYFSVCVITKWANDQYEIAAEGHKAEGKDADEDEDVVSPQEQADRMLHILMMIPFATAQKDLDNPNSSYLFPPPCRNLRPDERTEDDEESSAEENSEEDDSDDENDDDSSRDGEEEVPRKKRRTASQPTTKKQFDYQDVKCHLRELSKAWMSILRLPLSTASLKKALPFLSQYILPKVQHPLRFADFFMHAYGGADGNDKEDDEDDTEGNDATGDNKPARGNLIIPLLALDGLFYLMTQHRLEYPQFYGQLYALLQPSLFYIKYRARFFALLQKCLLRNEMLPAHLVAAFLKRLLQCALQAPPPGALFVLALSSNLLRQHEECAALIHRGQNEDSEEGMEDVYDPNTDDPVECRALESSLWELNALEKHFHPAVATLAKSIGREDPKSPLLQLDEMALHSYASLIEQERKRQVKSSHKKRKHGGFEKNVKAITPVTFVKPSALFSNTDVFSGILKVTSKINS